MTADGPSSFDRAWPLIEAACVGTISDRQLQDLQELLRGDAALQRAYLQYCRLHAELRCHCRAGAANHAALAKVAQAETADAREPAEVCDAARWPVIDCGPLGQAGPLPSSGFTAAWHGAAACLLGHPWAFSYLTATVFFAVMFAVGSFVSVSLGPAKPSWTGGTAGDGPMERKRDRRGLAGTTSTVGTFTRHGGLSGCVESIH